MLYFNNAFTGYPKPESVLQAIDKQLKTIPYICEDEYFNINNKQEDVLKKNRKIIANFFNVRKTEEIILTSGATEALNLIIKGLPLHDAHIITTNIEHNSVYRPLKEIEKEKNTDISIVETDKYGIINVDYIEREIKKNTKAVILNHSSNITGTINDINKIAEQLKKHKLFVVVDSSLTAGNIPIDLSERHIDFLVFTAHKFLYGLSGTGGLFMKETLDISPLKVGGTYLRCDQLSQPHERPLYYESGTHNFAGISSLGAGIGYINDIGLDNINDHNNKLYNKLINALLNNPDKITVYSNAVAENNLPIVSFNIKNKKPEKVSKLLKERYQIIIQSGLHCSPLLHKQLDIYPEGCLRASFTYMNNEKEIDELIGAVLEIASS